MRDDIKEVIIRIDLKRKNIQVEEKSANTMCVTRADNTVHYPSIESFWCEIEGKADQLYEFIDMLIMEDTSPTLKNAMETLRTVYYLSKQHE